ncbi:MAG TPA: PGPGW domain-containing protein [Pseudonocardiaceae bacterium]|nr:PGPGW domain-containing protein [Pseudonocardiaceae bacterium]
MIPYPGPGWLVVFAGLIILGTEFAWPSAYWTTPGPTTTGGTPGSTANTAWCASPCSLRPPA